jgi:nicotinic acid mononucleotide adenylyltransferase
LFAEIAEECRFHYPVETRFSFVCGRDAAERIIGWDYGEPGAIQRILRGFELLVAPRGGPFEAPPELRDRVHPLEIRDGYHEVSSTEVRDRITRGKSWEHLVSQRIVPMVRAIYS